MINKTGESHRGCLLRVITPVFHELILFLRGKSQDHLSVGVQELQVAILDLEPNDLLQCIDVSGFLVHGTFTIHLGVKELIKGQFSFVQRVITAEYIARRVAANSLFIEDQGRSCAL